MYKLARFFFSSALVLALGSLIAPASAQITCTANAGVPPLLRSDGLSEPVADYVLTCTSGPLTLPTAAGSSVPQINLEIILNSVVTSKITASDATGTYTEALALIDEPNTPTTFMWPNGRPVLSCGQTGAPDNGPSGPGVCNIIGDGTPTDTYNGIGNISATPLGTVPCDGIGGDPAAGSYGCGRPNAFQGRLFTGGSNNVIQFLGIPFDPPGAGTRTIRITNLRANAYLLGAPTQVLATVAVNGTLPFTVNDNQQTVGFIQPGLAPGSCGTPAASTVRLCEGFASSWKTKNLSFLVGDNLATPGNGTFSGSSYVYTSGSSHYPADIAQNVPGSIFNTESLFEWQNSAPNGPPPTNPPTGFAGAGLVPNLGNPLGSGGYTLTNTNPGVDGVATAGTRFALQFSGVPGGASVHVPLTVNLYRVACSPCVPTGVLALTNADAAGGGPYSAAVTTTLGASNMAVYETLFTDPFSIEYADVTYTVTGGSAAGVVVGTAFAPFYSTAAAGQPSLTGYVPRFASTSEQISNLTGVITGMNLPGGTTTSLNAKVKAALADVAANNLAGACSDLGSLISEAKAQSGKKLTVAQANTIINMAMALQAQLGC